MPFVIIKQETFRKTATRLLKRRINRTTYCLSNSKSLVKLIVLITFFTTLGILSRDISAKRNVTIGDALRNVRIKKWTADSTNEHSNRRIFFHETSGRSRLTLRQCCAVESAAKNNPTRPVELYLSVDQLLDFDQIKACVTVLDNYPNVDIFLVDNDEYFKGTVLENWYTRGEWRTSEFKVAHLSDFVRLVSLWRGGGFYLDIDYIIVRELPLARFSNFLVIEGLDGGLLNNGVMHLDANHWLVDKLMRYIDENYDPGDYHLHGPRALSIVFHDLCKYDDKVARKKACPDIKLVSYTRFCPIGAPFWELTFDNVTDYTAGLVSKSYGIHLWNFLSSKKRVDFASNQLYALVARQSCPHSVRNEMHFVDQQ